MSAAQRRRRQPSQSATSTEPERRSVGVPLAIMVIFLAITAAVFWRSGGLTEQDAPRITGTGWGWVALGAVSAGFSFVCSAAVMHGLSPVSLSFRVMFIGQLAGAASKVVAPAASGVVGLNTRLLIKNGAGLAGALTAVAATQVAQLGLTAVLIVILLPFARGLPQLPQLRAEHWWIVLAVAIALIGGYIVVRAMEARGARFSLRENIREGLVPLKAASRSPWRIMLIVGGSLGLTGCLIVTMWSSMRAIGATPSWTTAAVVLMVGAALGAFVPTPGGVGGVEASMVTLFLAAGQPAVFAMPGVLLFRVLSFWIPAPIGAIAAVWLRRHDHL